MRLGGLSGRLCSQYLECLLPSHSSWFPTFSIPWCSNRLRYRGERFSYPSGCCKSPRPLCLATLFACNWSKPWFTTLSTRWAKRRGYLFRSSCHLYIFRTMSVDTGYVCSTSLKCCLTSLSAYSLGASFSTNFVLAYDWSVFEFSTRYRWSDSFHTCLLWRFDFHPFSQTSTSHTGFINFHGLRCLCFFR